MVVTISASYGAGGAYVGPKLAERLGVPFVDRAIPNEVAQRLAVPLKEAVRHDETAGSVFERFIRVLAPAGLAFGARPFLEHEVVDEAAYRDATEQVIREQAEREGGVFLGRAAAIVLRESSGAFHVRLYGPRERRVDRAAANEELTREEAERRLADNDRAREAYVHHFYGASPDDLRLYHLAVDTTEIDLDCCVDMIASAVERR
ncbi:MAG TPA: cytidylate kinase-like family protein [Solirubrobacteraceae bacterium]|nr:cytidylate kinase-like family protein [Solirubrobacteraceae bacterium]